MPRVAYTRVVPVLPSFPFIGIFLEIFYLPLAEILTGDQLAQTYKSADYEVF